SMGFGVAQLVAGFMPGYVAFVLVLVPMGALFMTYVTTLNATFQLSVDPQMRGRAMSMFLLVFMGVAPIGAPVVGLLADTFGPQYSLIVGGAVTIVVVGVISALLMRVRGVRARALLPRRFRGPERAPVECPKDAGAKDAGAEEPKGVETNTTAPRGVQGPPETKRVPEPVSSGPREVRR
uniref:MFS transporter n=1 Tax=Nocardiopsis alkaliphila TaxID=225762 RepID=UPI00035EF3E5